MQKEKPFVVYAHQHNGKTLYVGCGRDPRHKNRGMSSHGPGWREVVGPVRKEITVKVIRRFETAWEAAKHEAACIRRLKPPANCTFNDESTHAGRGKLARSRAAFRYAVWNLGMQGI